MVEPDFPEALYESHLDEVLSQHREAMQAEGVNVLVLDSGAPSRNHHDDDHGPSARVAPNFARLVPIIEHPDGHIIIVDDKAERPKLLFHIPKGDFWQKSVPLPEGLSSRFDVQIMGDLAELQKEVARITGDRNAASIGPGAGGDETSGKLKLRLEWERRFKTPFEIACVQQASRTAAAGHLAARDSFLGGGSELDMHLAFLRAAGATDDQMAFPSIVSLNANTAYLHRPEKDPHHRDGGRALIDAGTRFANYDSDITTTWVREGKGVHEIYIQLLAGLETIQKELCAAIKPGVDFVGLHEKAHSKIAKLLIELGVLKDCTAGQAVEKRYTAAFFPHGLGHLLGIQTHDKGGKQAGPTGGVLKPPSGDRGDHPMYAWLRTLGSLREREIVTVEPGIYFFPELLAPFRSGGDSNCFNWTLIDQLDGGMRLESDVLVLANGFRDMTAEVLDRKTNVKT